MQDFRRIEAWKRAHLLALAVRKVTRKFPRSGYSDLKSQMIKAAESVPTNIVEGCGAHGNKEFARYLDISIKSSNELEYLLQLAKDNGVLADIAWQTLTKETIEIRKMICGYRGAVLRGARKPKKKPPAPDQRAN